MKKNILIFLALLFIYQTKGQLLLTTQIPPTGVFLKSQLWNIAIVNPSNPNLTVRIEMTFSELGGGHQIFSGTSGPVTLIQNVTQLKETDLTPIIYNLTDPSYNVDLGPGGFLPIGDFEVCFSIVHLNGEVPEILAEECQQILIEPLSPPFLLSPANNEATEVTRPYFMWIPPSPSANINNLNYSYLLVQLEGNQTAEDAIQQNIPLYIEHNITSNSLQYPSTIPELDSGKTYAWQIVANSNNNSVAKSDALTFRIRDSLVQTSKTFPNIFYSPLRRENDASLTTQSGIVHFEYLNEIRDSVALIRLFDLTKHSETTIIPLNNLIPLKLGENYIDLDLSNETGIIDRHIYLLELNNIKGERWYLKFDYRRIKNN